MLPFFSVGERILLSLNFRKNRHEMPETCTIREFNKTIINGKNERYNCTNGALPKAPHNENINLNYIKIENCKTIWTLNTLG